MAGPGDSRVPGRIVSRVEAIEDYKLPCHSEAMIKVKVNVDAANKKMKGYCVTESSFFINVDAANKNMKRDCVTESSFFLWRNVK